MTSFSRDVGAAEYGAARGRSARVFRRAAVTSLTKNACLRRCAGTIACADATFAAFRSSQALIAHASMRISAIVDARFRLIADGVSV